MEVSIWTLEVLSPVDPGRCLTPQEGRRGWSKIVEQNKASLPQWFNFICFLWLVFPTKNDEETNKFIFFARETD